MSLGCTGRNGCGYAKKRVRAAGEMQSCVPGDQPVYPILRQLTSKPPIVTQIDGLLTPAECAYLVQAASDAGCEASKTEGRGEDRSVRTSRTVHLPENDEVVACVGRRLATVAGKSAPRSAAKLHASDEPRAAASNELCPRAALQTAPRRSQRRWWQRSQAPTQDHLRIFTSRRRAARGEVWRCYLLRQFARKRWEGPTRVPARW